ncbi:hypothetical protein NDU88_004933 [Pleurodeles waltl]|uniref:Uncharacterized protein n=1 Tax=Pleurodeles waltl TaxID=8319 RepID=A0AAV7RKK7_PLEWA|nr:hypothetical protein NDU88_004933 [Pleurodeles waltl]
MACVTGERALAFTTEELEKLVDRVLPLYAKLCQHPSEEGTLASHRQGSADPGSLQPAEHPLQEAVEGPEALGQEDQKDPAGEGQRGRDARRTLTH